MQKKKTAATETNTKVVGDMIVDEGQPINQETPEVKQEVEDKKADIERRRQDELKERIVYDRKPTIKDGEFRIVGDPNKQVYRINENTGRLQVKDSKTGLWTVEGTHGKIELETAQRHGFEKLKENINAKYDAELAALENKTQEESNQEQPTEIPQENSNIAITHKTEQNGKGNEKAETERLLTEGGGEVSKEADIAKDKSSPISEDWSKDVESTAKALDGVGKGSVENSSELESVIGKVKSDIPYTIRKTFNKESELISISDNTSTYSPKS